MNRYVLDTNVLVHFANEYTGWQEIVSRMDAAGRDNIFISVGTVFEVARMAERAKMKKRVIDVCMQMIGLIQILPWNASMAALAGSVHGSMMNKGKAISESDAMIAAAAMWHDYILVTDDGDFSPLNGITIENWVRA